jgi:hypothetical protein
MFSKETRIMQLEARKHLLNARDPGMNAKLIKKIDRELRKLNGLK